MNSPLSVKPSQLHLRSDFNDWCERRLIFLTEMESGHFFFSADVWVFIESDGSLSDLCHFRSARVKENQEERRGGQRAGDMKRKRCSEAKITQSVRFAQHLPPVREQFEQESFPLVSTKRTQQPCDGRKQHNVVVPVRRACSQMHKFLQQNYETLL